MVGQGTLFGRREIFLGQCLHALSIFVRKSHQRSQQPKLEVGSAREISNRGNLGVVWAEF